MNILVIGNGFDLAHGLPTKYTDFLDFCKVIINVYTVDQRDTEDNEEMEQIWNELDLKPSYNFDGLKELFYNLNLQRTREEKSDEMDDTIYYENITTNTHYDDFYDKIKNNIWIEYFLQCNMYQKENWIDFESEISKVIQDLENDIHSLNNDRGIDNIIVKLSNGFLYRKYSKNVNGIVSYDKETTYKKVRNKLLYDLNSLIKALEIYLSEYVEKIEIEKKSPDIASLKIDFILSFNYTHIFSKLYDVSRLSTEDGAVPFDYIHGEADINKKIDTNNMVLGIDEYLPDDRKNKDIEFIAFKKFYQRICKGTGCKYKNWVDNIWEEKRRYEHIKGNIYPLQIPFNIFPEEYRHCIYFFGHSLDVTDKDILRDLILNDNIYTTIFYRNQGQKEQQIANLVKVIGQDELIGRTGGNTQTIKFVLQKPMEPIED